MITAHHGFDHLYTKVADIHAARAALGEMGFSMTSLDEQTASSMGLTSVVFPNTWLAFSGPIGTDLPDDLDAVVGDQEKLDALPTLIAEQLSGLGAQPLLILSVSDLKTFTNECASHKLQPSEPTVFPRPTLTENGAAEIRFEMTGTEPLFPRTELEIVGLKHLTPDVFFRPVLLKHENGATGINAVTLLVQEPERLSNRLTELFAQSQAGAAELLQGLFGSVDVRLDDKRSGVDIAVCNIKKTRELLSGRGVDFAEQDEALVVRDPRLAWLPIQFAQSD